MNHTKIKLAALFVPIIIFTAVVLYQTWFLYNTKTMNFDTKLREISGLELDKNGQIWAINDGGNGPFIYQIDKHGAVTRKIEIENAVNWDWEDLTQDRLGHFFIGDFGNNGKDRRWMTIYKIENPIDIKTETAKAEIIKFTYPDFGAQDPNNVFKDAHYDIEAFVYFNRRLYLFTKNRTSPFDGLTRLYKIGDHAANFKADYIGQFQSCTELKELCWITSAAMSPDGKQLVLLDSQRLWIFENWKSDNFFSGDAYQVNLGIVTQKEAVTFIDESHVIFTDEVFNGIGGNGYVVDLRNVKKTPVKMRKEVVSSQKPIQNTN